MLASEVTLGNATALDDRAFNVGTGQETSVNQLAVELMRAAARQVGVQHAAARPGELNWSCLDCRKLRRLGWRTEVDLPEGLSRTYRWIARRAT